MNKRLQEALMKSVNDTPRYKDNQYYQEHFKDGDWIVLGYNVHDYVYGLNEDNKLDDLEYVWVVKIQMKVEDFRVIEHDPIYLVLFDKINGGLNPKLLKDDIDASQSSAQRWFRPLTSIERWFLFEKLMRKEIEKI